MKAVWNGTVLAESERTLVVEGNHYFPPDAIRADYFVPSSAKTICSWKGIAHYFDIVVGGQTNKDAAWTYPSPTDAAQPIKSHIAFWRGIQVEQ